MLSFTSTPMASSRSQESSTAIIFDISDLCVTVVSTARLCHSARVCAWCYVQELFEIHAEFTKLEKIEFTGIKGKQLSSQTMRIFDDFNELYKKFTFITYDPLNPEDEVSGYS